MTTISLESVKPAKVFPSRSLRTTRIREACIQLRLLVVAGYAGDFVCDHKGDLGFFRHA
jgi:hypothetical protein